MANDANNVSVGKPLAAGGIYIAPLGTALPTDATTALDAAFESAGYVSEDGLTNSTSLNNQDINEWGGKTVLTVVTSYAETYNFSFLETNETVLKARYGADNVKTDTNTGLTTITHQAPTTDGLVYVFEIALTNNKVKRIVVPNATISDTDDIQYTSGNALVYPVTLAANASDEIDGGTSREFIATVNPLAG